MRDEPTHDFRALLDRPESPGSSVMAGGHVGLEHEVMRIGLACPQLCDPLGRFGIAHLAVIEACGNEHRRVAFSREIVVGRIRQHVIVFWLYGRIAPFVVFECRERGRDVGHRGNEIHERHFLEIGTQIGDRAHE